MSQEHISQLPASGQAAQNLQGPSQLLLRGLTLQQPQTLVGREGWGGGVQSTSFGMHKLLAPMEYFSPKPFCTPLTVHWSQLAGSERPLNWPIANLFQIPACQQSPSPVLQNTRHFCPTVHTPTLKTEFWSPGSACEVVQQPKGISKPRRPLCCLYSCCTRHTEPPHRPLPFPILHREALQYNCMA